MKEMRVNSFGYLESDTHRECTKCRVIFEKTSKMTLCKSCNCSRVKCMTPQWKMWQRAKQRAKARGQVFSLDVEDIVIPDVCPATGIRLNMNSGKSGAYKNSPSLDRVDNSKGYVKGNVQVLSQCANAMKGAASEEELVRFAEWVLRTYRRDVTPPA